MLKSGITKRWLLTTILVITLIIACISVSLSVLLHVYYYDVVKDKLQSFGQSTSVADYFSSYIGSSQDIFRSRAHEYVENFQDINIAEVWVLDKNAEVIVSSTGFVNDGEKLADYEMALSSPSGKAFWRGHLSSGEKVMAMTVLLPLTNGKSNGAVRYIISLELIDKQVLRMDLLLCFISLFALLLVIASGMFFVKSIVEPVKNLNSVTRKIAEGDYTQKVIVRKRYDEITELADSINYMSDEIAKTDRLKNDFISTISHELRTPLTAIKGWTETLLCVNENKDVTVDDGLKVILGETERLYSLVEDLLDFSKMESGRLVLRLKKIDAFAELDDAVVVLKDRATRKGINIFYSIPDTAAPVYGDADRIKQVFVNILDNAIKYTDEGGNISIVSDIKENEISVIITDNGCGINATDLPRIKEKFYKANLSVKGSGIGLAVCDEIINLHKGKLEISSTEGKGTKVEVVLPLADNEE